jgi:hypothetical protein
MALGAERGRLMRQLLTQRVMLSVTGALFGIVLAHWGARLLVGLLASNVYHENQVFLDLRIDSRMLAFTAGVASLTGTLCARNRFVTLAQAISSTTPTVSISTIRACRYFERTPEILLAAICTSNVRFRRSRVARALCSAESFPPEWDELTFSVAPPPDSEKCPASGVRSHEATPPRVDRAHLFRR